MEPEIVFLYLSEPAWPVISSSQDDSLTKQVFSEVIDNLCSALEVVLQHIPDRLN